MDCFKLYERSDPFKLYEVKDKIGTGGFSLVYRAVDRLEREEYALKVIHKGQMTAM